MAMNIEQRLEQSAKSIEQSSQKAHDFAEKDTTIQTCAGSRDSLPKVSRIWQENFARQMNQHATEFQDRFALSQQSLPWQASITISDSLQRYHVGVQGEEGYKEFLPNPLKLPFETAATLADDLTQDRWLENGVPNKHWTEIKVASALEKSLGVNARVWPKDRDLQVGDVVPSAQETTDGLPITHVIVDGNAYAMSPLASGLVSDLTATSATIGIVVVSFTVNHVFTFSSVSRMKSASYLAAMIDVQDVHAKTTSYYGGWAATLTPYGGAEYLLTTRQRVRDTLNDPNWEPDGFGDHYLSGGETYVAKIQLAGFTDVDCYGAKPNDPDFDSTGAFYAASVAARKIADGINLGNNNINPRPFVRFTPGVTYYQYSKVHLDVEAVRIDFRCEGVAVISGANPENPSVRNPLGWDFNQIYRTEFAGLSFAGFVKIHEWDTNNSDNATVVYDDCDFFNCGSPGVPAIDTRSYAESRSTELSLINCRCQFVPMLLDCYCDTLRFVGGRYKNYDANGCLVKADSLVTTEGGMFVPEVRGNNARFFDLYDHAVTGTRGFTSNGTRFSPEGGGIPVIYNYMDGKDAATNHLTNFIMFYGGANSASSGTLEGALVVLQDDGIRSIAPSMIGFYGASVRSNSGLVRTKRGLPVNKARGRFAIEVSEACQSHLTDINTPVSFPIVEDILRPYLVGGELYNEPTILTATGSVALDLVSINSGPQPILQFQNSGVTLTAISNAFDGQTVTIEFVGNSNRVVDFSNGSRLFLAGGVDFTGNAFSTITLMWHRAGNKWYEVGRCVR
ncbi:hypothetical protein VCSRO11_0354 [Vibrio cholerae]|nr:hypothetical protein VCSRO11_0354 [Vibrio cholerae]